MSKNNSTFLIALIQELMKNMNNWYGAENWDSEFFGGYETTHKSAMVSKINELFSGSFSILPVTHDQDVIQNISRIQDSLEELAYVYDLLADESSKSTLVKVLTYRLMGHKKVKLPLNTESYWSQRRGMKALINGNETIQINFLDWKLRRFALDKIGYPLEVFFLAGGVMATFILKQYEYRKRTPEIKAEAGDYVIDAGGCWGDTALYFAHEIGEHGKVFAFEFTADNLAVFNKNMSLNPELASRIEVFPKAMWESSGQKISYSSDGPATSLAINRPNSENSLEVLTVSIDDFVKEKKLPRVDFIKMDIEGAELGALRGAEETLRTFKPKLGISVYHKENDLIEIPTYLDKLGLGYRFFLDHFTIYGGETVLFATAGIS
jgi:FkbM family methyltransferase